MIKTIKKARIVNYTIQEDIAKTLDHHLDISCISYESTDENELTATASMAYGFIGLEKIEAIKQDILKTHGWELRILDFYPRGYEGLDHTHHTVSMYLYKESNEAKLWREASRYDKAILEAFIAIKFGYNFNYNLGYHLTLYKRYMEYGSATDLWDLDSKRIFEYIHKVFDSKGRKYRV